RITGGDRLSGAGVIGQGRQQRRAGRVGRGARVKLRTRGRGGVDVSGLVGRIAGRADLVAGGVDRELVVVGDVAGKGRVDGRAGADQVDGGGSIYAHVAVVRGV